jgi:hypothetical protein
LKSTVNAGTESDLAGAAELINNTHHNRQLTPLNPFLTFDMAPRNLLRYVFRHEPHAKARAATTPPRPVSYEPKDTTSATHKPVTHRELKPSGEDSGSPLAYKTRSDSQESQRSSILEDIAEESGSDDDKSSGGETTTPFEQNVQALGTRELVTATLYEARISTHAHLDSIDATLGLLDALDGLSATITVLKADFKDKREICEERMTMLKGIERAVERMRFTEEDLSKKGDQASGPVAHGRFGLELMMRPYSV